MGEGGGAGSGSGSGASGKVKKAVSKLFVQAWGSFCRRDQRNMVIDYCTTVSPVRRHPNFSSVENQISSEITVPAVSNSSPSSDKNLCTICLDPLNHSLGSSASQPIFTAQCSHAFHFACISSNIRHGSVTCPICRAHWTQLPRNMNRRCSLHCKPEPSLQILGDSIANLRIHRDATLLPVRDNGNDPIAPNQASDQSRLHMSLYRNFSSTEVLPDHLSSSTSMEPGGTETPFICSDSYLCVKLSPQPTIDLVLVATTNGPDLRLMKQAMALTVFSLRPTDRLAIITYSSGAAQAFPLRRMTSYSKRAALQVIDHLFHTGQEDPTNALSKAVEILGDRLHKNQSSCILHLTGTPSRSYDWVGPDQVPVKVQRFHIKHGFNLPDGFIRQEFEEFLAGALGGGVEDVQLRIGEGRVVVSIGELRGGEERNVPVCIGDSDQVRVVYRYRDGESTRRGEVVVGIGHKGEALCRDDGMIWGRINSVENWSYHDPSMARRWARHLHGYRLYT